MCLFKSKYHISYASMTVGIKIRYQNTSAAILTTLLKCHVCILHAFVMLAWELQRSYFRTFRHATT